MKHIDIKLDFIRCVVIIKAIKIEYISTKNQIAEVLTKGLYVIQNFPNFCNVMTFMKSKNLNEKN